MNYDRISSGFASPRPSLKQRLRSLFCFSCCFRASATGGAPNNERPTSLLRSSSTWIRSKAPELKERCRSLVSRIGKPHRNSADFTYDPLSYALNFDEGEPLEAGEFRYQDFSSRLPASPPLPANGAISATR